MITRPHVYRRPPDYGKRLALALVLIPVAAGGTTIECTLGTIAVGGANPEVEVGTTVAATVGAITVAGYNVDIPHVVDCVVGTLTIDSYGAEVEVGTTVGCAVDTLVIAGYNPTVLAGTTITCTLGTVAIAGINPEVEVGATVDVITGALVVAGYAAEVEVGTTIDCAVGAIVILGYNPTVSIAATDRYWVGGTTDWETAANWSASSGGAGGETVPSASNAVIFDDGGVGNCTLTANASAASIMATSGYSGDFDAATFNVAVGDVTLDGTGSWDMGSGTWTCSGSFDHADVGTFIRGTASLVMTGTAKTLTWGVDLNALAVSIGATITGAGALSVYDVQNDIAINGSLSIPVGKTLRLRSTGTLTIGAAGVLTGNGAFLSDGPWPNFDNSAGGTVNIASLTLGIVSGSSKTRSFVGDVDSATVVLTSSAGSGVTHTWQLGNAAFAGNVTVSCTGLGTTAIDNTASDPDLVFQGDVAITPGTGAVTWAAGTGTITLSGTSAQDVDFAGLSVEDVVINKSAETVTLSGALSCESFTLTDGTLDIDGNNITTVSSGNFTQAAGTTCQDTTGGGLVTVDGNFAINGADGNECVWNGPDLAVTGTAIATYTTATDSNAGGGTEIDAGGTSTDGGGNSNWSFVAAAVAGPFQLLAGQVYTDGAAAGQLCTDGALVGQVYIDGSTEAHTTPG